MAASGLSASLSAIVWGPFTMALLAAVGILFSIRFSWFPIRFPGLIFRKTLGSLFQKNRLGKKREGGISPFQAFSTALAATAGVGNIAGVAGAIAAGGPGAVFWMWVSALFGMSTKYAEIVLASGFRRTLPGGGPTGGPMYYMEDGLGSKALAVLFSVSGCVACIGAGSATQAAELSAGLTVLSDGKISPVLAGAVLAIFVFAVISGGIRRIGKVASLLVPIMVGGYLLVSLGILAANVKALPTVFSVIMKNAFSFRSAGGGLLGYGISRSMSKGVARGIFSNEAGLGTAPIAYAASCEKSPVEQGFWGIMEVFLDTTVMCTITGLVIVLSGRYETGTTGGPLASEAYDAFLAGGGKFVSASVVLFALMTVVSWEYYGERCLAYLCGESRTAVGVFRFLYALSAFAGAAASASVFGGIAVLGPIWNLADICDGMMVLPNLIALLLLSKIPVKATREYFGRLSNRRQAKTKPPAKLKIRLKETL